jgi:parallel beta helix pectate lyase-like protein
VKRLVNLMGALGALLIFVSPVHAAIFAVQATATPGTCIGDNSHCTLQDALDIASTNGSENTINVDPGNYHDVCGASFPYNYEPDHGDSLTIQNSQAGFSVVDGQNCDRVFNIDTSAAGGDGSATITLKGLIFQNGNAKPGPRNEGGGIKIKTTAAQVVIIQSAFLQNFAANHGGGAFITTDSGPIHLEQSLFSRNQISDGGDFGAGLLAESNSGEITLEGNTFLGNFVIAPSSIGFLGPNGGGGAALLTDTGNINVIGKNEFSGNSSGDLDGGGGLYVNHLSDTDINNATISGGNLFAFNQSNNSAGGVSVAVNGDLVFQGNIVTDNGAMGIGAGGVGLAAKGSLTIDSNLILRNTANATIGSFGGGGILFNSPDTTLTNNVISDNVSNRRGGGILGGPGNVTITHNTIFQNTTFLNGGGVAIRLTASSQTANIYNNIIFGNGASTGNDLSFDLSSGGVLNIFNNDFAAAGLACTPDCSTAATGSNLDNIDPQFVDATNDDFSLQAASPMIDQGDPNPPGGLPNPDLVGNPRPATGSDNPDLGALEFQPTSPASPGPVSHSGGCQLGGGVASPSIMILFLLLPLGMFLKRLNKSFLHYG